MEIILFILFVVASVVFRILQPRIKGYLGEKSVATILSLLPSDKYKIINDLLIEVDGRTIQIDHLVVSIYGIFVIETKNYKGRITGSDNSDYWTKNMFGNKYTFYNPIRQNKSHVLALSKQLGFSLNKFIPIIVFSNGAELKVNTTHNVIYTTQINRVIKEYSEIKFSETDIQKLYDKISLLNIVSPEVRKQHVLEIQNTIATKRHLIQQGICPRCGHIGYFINKGKTYKHNYPRLIDEELFRIVQDTMEGRKRAPSKLYYGDKQYIFTGLVRCGCCGSLMTCETKVKDENHSYNYLKCNKLRSKCSQKPVNEAKILAQLENELCLPMDINDDMLKNIKSEVKKRLKEENINTANLKRDITIKLHDLDEQIKTLFRGYIQGKCDEKMYNELKTEIELEKEKLQKDMDRYLEIDTETDETLVNIAEIAANVGKFLKSPIISQKRDILNLILSDCKTERKNLCFSITKPFDKLLKTPEINKWCR